MKGMTNNVKNFIFKLDRLHDKIDRNTKNGKSNERDERVSNHLTDVATDGSRTWTF